MLANVHAIRIAKENEWEIGSYARLLLGNETTLNVLGIGIRFVEIIGGEHMTEIAGVLGGGVGCGGWEVGNGIDEEECVEERGNETYRFRILVMSTNDGWEKEGLFV